MNNIVNVDLSKAAINFPQKIEALIAGQCPQIIPLNAVISDDFTRGIYNTSGYVRLSSLKNMSAFNILNIAERTLECIETCKDYLFFPDEYVLSIDTVYIKEDFKEAKLLYIPEKRTSGENGAVSYFIFSLKSLTTENGRTYLDTLGNMMECKNLRISRVIAFVEELKREIVLFGIE